ncbi:hypothetical protein E8E14_001448 [Neopestalotiopsis sp. 37M]|nr:hypothetical protein E8E14_001448 [Neopestalotiopsis sp. 37M]
MECRQTDGVRKRSTRKPDINHRTSQLEERLNDLVEILRLQQASGSKHQAPSQENDSQTTVSRSSGNHASSGAYPTPPTGIASLGSQTGQEGPISSTKAFEDDLTPFEAESILQRFRNGYLTMFPATHQTRGKGFQARYANLANSLIQDLRLDQPFNPNAGGNCWFPQSKVPATSPEHTHEQRRAVIGTFILSSSISSFLKIDVTRWNSHMEESLEKLAADPEYPGDELLVAMARAKVIVNDVGRLTWKRTGNELAGPPSVYVKPLKDRVQAIRRSLKPELVENRVIQSHLYNAEVLIGEMAIFHSTTSIAPSYNCQFPGSLPLPATQSPAQGGGNTSPSGLRPIDLTRLETLHECLHSIKQSITTIQSFEPAAWPTFPFAVMGHMSHSLQMLFRLSALDSEPDWDAAAVRRDFDVIAVIHRLADTMSRVADAAGLTGDPDSGPHGDMFSKGVGTLRATASIWGSALPPLEDPAAASSSASAAAADPFGTATDAAGLDTMAMLLDFQNDPWLTELYNSWEAM